MSAVECCVARGDGPGCGGNGSCCRDVGRAKPNAEVANGAPEVEGAVVGGALAEAVDGVDGAEEDKLRTVSDGLPGRGSVPLLLADFSKAPEVAVAEGGTGRRRTVPLPVGGGTGRGLAPPQGAGVAGRVVVDEEVGRGVAEARAVTDEELGRDGAEATGALSRRGRGLKAFLLSAPTNFGLAGGKDRP